MTCRTLAWHLPQSSKLRGEDFFSAAMAWDASPAEVMATNAMPSSRVRVNFCLSGVGKNVSSISAVSGVLWSVCESLARLAC